MSETTFYQDGDVTVTNARAILGAKTYAMSNITSVAMGTKPAERGVGIGLVLAGLVLGVIGASVPSAPLIFLAVPFLGGGIAAAAIAKPSYIVRIGSASGESDALASQDEKHVKEIVAALNEAIVGRG